MNLADMLCYADIDQLTRIADTYGCQCSSHSKNDLIQSILSAVRRRDALENRMAELGGEDLRFLNSLLFENRSAYSLEELRARIAGPAAGSTLNLGQAESLTGVQEAEHEPAVSTSKRSKSRKTKKTEDSVLPSSTDPARKIITRFKRFGWLFNGYSQQTRFLFQVPEDVKRKLCETMESKFRGLLQEREEPPVYRDESNLLVSDLPIFLRYVRDHDIPLTSEGVMYKRQLGQVLELMSVEEAIPGKGGWRFGYGRKFRDYPDRFSLLYDFAYYEGLLREQPDRLVLTEEGLDAADGKIRYDTAAMYRLWLRIYKGPIDNLTAIVHWVARLSVNWTTTDSLFGILQPIIRSFYYDEEKVVLERRVLRMMMHLGLLRWGETAEGESVVRMTPHGNAVVTGTALPYEDLLRFDDGSMTFT